MAVKDYTAATEVDPNNRYTVTLNKVAISGLKRNEDAYLYWDEGVDYFSGDYEHIFEAQMDSGAGLGAGFGPWGLSNDIDDINGLISGGKDGHFAFIFNNGGQYTVDFYEIVAGTVYSDRWSSAVADTHYYFKSKRDEAGGTIQLFIYSDSVRTILLDTLVLSLHENEDFRYVWAAISGNTGATGALDGFSQNLDLEAAVDISIVFGSIITPKPIVIPVSIPASIPGGSEDNTWITN